MRFLPLLPPITTTLTITTILNIIQTQLL